MGHPTWGVVSTIDEPAPLVIAFAAWHLGIGASEVHIFLDQPNPEAEAVLTTLPGCHVTVTDEAYWAASPQGRRYHRHTSRQEINANKVYQSTSVDWLLHCDADEFIADGDWITTKLAEQPEEITSVHLKMLERAYLEGQPEETIFDGVFRRPRGTFEDWGKEMYGRFAKFLRSGITGHTAGKALTRTGRDVTIGIHYPKYPDGNQVEERVSYPNQLLHFDGLTRLHYVLKVLRRVHEPKIKGHPPRPHGASREGQMRYMRRNAGKPSEIRRIANGVKSINETQVLILETMMAAERFRFDPRPVLVEMGVTLDLSPEAFDAELIERDAELIEQAGLVLPF